MDWTEKLTTWYEGNRRDLPWRKTRDPYRVWISEIMLQQTRVAAVIPYYERFLNELPSVQDLAIVPDDRLLKLWQGLGYYSRAWNLKKAANEIVRRFKGSLPGTYRELLTLPGIGSYTAAAIASISFGERVPAVDGNVLRVYARLTGDYRDIADPHTKVSVFSELSAVMPDLAGTFNQAMMELGATVCVPNGLPLCEKCPLADRCRAKRNGLVADLPVKSKKALRSIEQMSVFLIRKDDSYLIRKRPATGLLAGLYELPNTEGHLNVNEALSFVEACGIRPTGAITEYDRTHVFTHKEWHMHVFAFDTASPVPAGWLLYDGKQSVPTAFSICLS